ncbi:MAG: tetratricopeptide repeat protein [Anaerolineae bacterium]|nr:tetratricopeptide repeat protein [Anaerolineae bacterium]
MQVPDERGQLEGAIAALEAQRALLGDAAVDAAITGIRRQLANLGTSHPERRRKQVTVLFADVSGFTAMSEKLDAEDVYEILNVVWFRLDRVIVEHGGRVDKHTGDGVMALWGVETTREDDAEWAVRAALAMQCELGHFELRVKDLVARLKLQGFVLDVRMRIGISTGPVLLGEVSTTGEFSAIGDTINVASRLQEVAPVGGVLIAHTTYSQVRGIFDMQSQDPLCLKGKTDPLQTYWVQCAKPRAFRMSTRGVEGIETSMVGRDVELRVLQDAYRAVVEQVATQVVTVVGDAGVGKSRLLYEFENWLTFLPEQVYYLKGRATPEMQSSPYSIIRDMFAYRFAIRESDNATTVLEKFREGMDGYLDVEQADLVGHLIGFDFRQAGSRSVRNLLGSVSFQQLALAYLVTYIRAVTRRPTVIFLEDIHWADDRSLALVRHLVNEVAGVPLLVVCLARPMLFERYADWGEAQASAAVTFTRLSLSPLSPDASSALVTQILRKVDAVPPALVDLIVDGAEGNPYYVEELIKVLIDDGVIIRGEACWRTDMGRLTALRVPPTLIGVLQARLDGLSHEQREVLQRASVVGRLFWDAAVVELMIEGDNPVSQAQVKRALDNIRDRELVFRRTHSSFQGTGEYLFKHAILRDVTYQTVLLEQRRMYHGRVAQWLEANAGERLDEYLGLIAGHYELSAEPVKAVAYLSRLGTNARAVSAYQDAIAAFTRALALLPVSETAERAILLTQMGYAYRQVSDYPVAMEHLKEGLALARAAGDIPAEIMALNGLGWTLMGQGKYDEASPYLIKSLTLARRIDDHAGLALALHHLGDVAYRRGHSDEAARYAWECLALYQMLHDLQGIAGALRILGFVAYMRGQYANAMQHHEESRQIYESIGDRWGVGTGYINLGETARRQGQFKEAARYYQQSLPFFHEIGNRFGAAIALLNLGHAYNGLDEEETAWDYFRASIAQAHTLGALAILLENLLGIAWIRARRGQVEAAAELLGLVQNHPEYNAEIGQFIAPIMEVVCASLSESHLEAILARGARLAIEDVVGEFL